MFPAIAAMPKNIVIQHDTDTVAAFGLYTVSEKNGPPKHVNITL